MSIEVNPAVLTWARETAGFTLEEAADKLFNDTVTATAAEKLERLEVGEKHPSRTQLKNFANLYKRPLLAFYMAEPPRLGRRGQDFRQSPDSRSARDNAKLDALLRDVKARQETVREILLDDEDFIEREFVGSITMAPGVGKTVHLLSAELGFNHIDPTQRRGKPDDLFKRLRAAAEDMGVFVLLMSNLGSHHSTIEADVFRGFAIADKVAPFVVINAKDARPARAFTLIHELAHIWLGQTGVSGAISTQNPVGEAAQIERFCNDVAGEFLLPDAVFRNGTADFDPSDVEGAKAIIDGIASRWSVSEPMVAYRLHRRGELTKAAYQTLGGFYHARWQAILTKQKEKQTDGVKIDAHVIRQSNLGRAFVDLIHRTVRSNALTYTKAANLLGSKPNAVEPLLRKFEAKRTNGDLFAPANGTS